MWKLIIEDEEGKRTVVPLTRDDYTIGRKEGNNIRLTERNVSRDHAALHRKKNGAPHSPRTPGIAAPASVAVNPSFFLEDHQSYNGVYVNGLRVAQTQDLLHGDLIQIGDYRIVLHDDAAVEQPPANATIPDDTKATLPNVTTRGSLLLERPNRLVMLAGPTPGLEYPLDRERLTIGRAEDAAISVNHNSVSRLHCEIHSLGEGRYEIVDKGSSNGVRVNGADLRRGIIEAGDIIELGDVRFKFVGAGQIFLPGATDTHQFESIGERSANAVSRSGRGVGVIPWLLFGMILASAAVGIWAYLRQQKLQSRQSPAPTTQVDPSEAQALKEAAQACIKDNHCEEAHDKVMQKVASGSSLQNDPQFKEIELRWAEQIMERALNEIDPAKKRSLYELVDKQPTVDEPHRKMASDRLRELDAQNLAMAPRGVPAPKDSGSHPTGVQLTSAPEHTEKLDRPSRQASADSSGSHTAPKSTSTNAGPQPAAPAPSGTPASGASGAAAGSVAEQVRAIMLKDPDGARKLLQPRVNQGHATKEEIGLLKTICREQRDQVCLEQTKRLLEK
ncbi:FHA domain-containing protein [Pendulispora albinea]|uniref:FHA domain-containing protein n=1 Tax=Pendulispora albinea TaxID=2741071 RepID=A0ABZ2M0G4_9BACT